MSGHESLHSHEEKAPVHHNDEHSIARTNSHNSMKTERLFDHRNQADGLPIRRGSVLYDTMLPQSAIPFQEPDFKATKNKSSNKWDNESAIADSPTLGPSNTKGFRHSGDNFGPTAIISDQIPPASSSNFTHKRTRSRSLTDQVKNILVRDEAKEGNRRTSSRGTSEASPMLYPLNKSISRQSNRQRGFNDLDTEMVDFERRRRMTRASVNDSDADSHGSRESQETEEDVCFPMVPEHVKINGIDFDELDEFIEECREEAESFKKSTQKDDTGYNGSSDSTSSAAAARYTPKSDESDTDDTGFHGVSFGLNKIEGEDTPPDRFSFFSSEGEETTHAPDIESLLKPGQTMKELFNNGKSTWWLDCVCPTDAEMKVLAKAFGIHPLTAEDIRMQETREKVELFKSYYFVCFHTFEADKESEDFLEPINVYIVVFRHGILTFHFGPISHAANVRRRVRQLRDYVDVSADWLCYALIDDITDSFAPVIHAIEYEADAIEDQVFIMRDSDFSLMLLKIGESRRKVMTLMRLLSCKADVIKMFAKRCQDEAQGIGPALTSNINLMNLSASSSTGRPTTQTFHPGDSTTLKNPKQAQPRADIALYLGDIQDHVVTMYQNLLSYEKIFSRSHSNYLAQLQVESFNSNNKVTEILSKVTVLGTILVPLNLVTGLFGMNVHVPAETVDSLGPFFGIVGGLIVCIIAFSIAANWWLTRNTREAEEESERRTLSNIRGKTRGIAADRHVESRSVLSFPSRINRYD
ncbi:hypothetical protein WICPIJ_007008 [Wickerhamomyces pijperi]|uniref:Magnesium transporter ALR2 n=1 Tax=Wickerhamomyces pijperi TaxID=599730 RepID=A0A9P8Q0Z4_WICPI|nr:hypothetical protein WICPIJ_007008 [Wickerhamomyces pijperi]